MTTVITDAVRYAFKDSRAKRIAGALGCAVITGKRIAATGHVGAAYRKRLFETLEQELGHAEFEIRRIRLALRSCKHVGAIEDAPSAGALDLLASADPLGVGAARGRGATGATEKAIAAE